jgi:hemerythrin-like domain-containing protein
VKRSEALRSLSRDHHKALSAALEMRRATDAAEGAAAFARYWEEHGKIHFRVEEEVLLPTWARLGNLDQTAALRLAKEHLEIRAAGLALDGRPDLEQVHALAEKLAEHVRFEERELFGLIERDLGPQELERLAGAVSEAERHG